MKKREKNLLILLGIVAVAAAVYFISNMNANAEYNELGLRADSAERIADLNLSTRGMPELNIDELEEDKATFTGAKRNLFVYVGGTTGSGDDEELDEEDDSDVYEVPVTDVSEDRTPVQRNPTLAGYEYIGLHQASENEPTAVFSWRGRTLVGRKGQVVNETFEIKEITRRFVLIHVLKGDFEQRLQLKNPAGATSGGMQ